LLSKDSEFVEINKARNKYIAYIFVLIFIFWAIQKTVTELVIVVQPKMSKDTFNQMMY
jgi:N-acyl-L-homoserine lactone synthetase